MQASAGRQGDRRAGRAGERLRRRHHRPRSARSSSASATWSSGMIIGLLSGGHCLIEGVPGLAKTLTVKTLSQTLDAQLRAHPVHARPAAGRHHRHHHLQHADGAVHPEEGADLRQPGAGRRDQPRAGQGAVGAARGHAGAPGHHRRRHLHAARAVPGHGHPEPDRAGGHLPAARGPARPLHAHDPGRLPQQGRGAADHGPHDLAGHRRAPRRCRRSSRSARPREVVGQIYIDDTIRDYIVDVIHATREPRAYGLQRAGRR